MSDAAFPLKQLNRTFTGSVLFIDIAGYSTRAVPERLEMKELFNTMLAESVQNVASGERIMLDTSDGTAIAIAFLGDTEEAMFVALSLRDSIEAADIPVGEPGFVRMGIGLGPLKIVRDINGHTNMIGDGVDDAQRVMRFAGPGQVMAAHSYFDIISGLSRDYAQLFVQDNDKLEPDVYRLGRLPEHEGRTQKLRSTLEDSENAFTTDSVRSNAPVAPLDKGIRLPPRVVAAAVCATTLAGAAWWWTGNPIPQPITATPVSAVPAMDAVAPTRIDATKAADIRAAVKHAAENPHAAPPSKPRSVKLSIQP